MTERSIDKGSVVHLSRDLSKLDQRYFRDCGAAHAN